MNTELSDIFVPEVFASYQTLNSTERTAFMETGVAVNSPALDAAANSGGFTITVPHWNDLDASIEPNYSNTTYSDIADTQKITSGEQVGRVSYLNEGFSSSDLNKELAGSDPMQRITERLDNYWARQFQRRNLAIMVGLYNENVANGGGDMVEDITDDTAPTDDNRFGSTAFVDALFTLGDRFDSMGVIAVHSTVMRRMVKQEEIEYLDSPAGTGIRIPIYKNHRVIVDDGLPTIGTGETRKFLSIVMGSGLIGVGRGTPRTPEEVERHPARANGGGVEVLWSRKTWLLHPAGYTFKSTVITAPGLSPTWADLNDATNWERVYDRKHIPLAFLLTNG